MATISFDVGSDRVVLQPEGIIIAGFAGRDRTAVERHIAELAAEGIPSPASVPAFYQAPASLLSRDERIVVTHEATSGEAEIALLQVGGRRYLTLASDHTDRRTEAIDIALSKLVCPKPIATAAWRYDDVVGHWDELRIRSWIWEDDRRRLYQDGRAGDVLSVDALVERIPFARPSGDLVVLTGTIPAIGGIRPSLRFKAELVDELRGESITLDYDIAVIDVLQPA